MSASDQGQELLIHLVPCKVLDRCDPASPESSTKKFFKFLAEKKGTYATKRSWGSAENDFLGISFVER